MTLPCFATALPWSKVQPKADSSYTFRHMNLMCVPCAVFQDRRILFCSRPSLPYDVLSIDIGITPAASSIPGAAQHTVPVKPIDKFVGRFDSLLEAVRGSSKALHVCVVGGGAGGVELALALQYRLMMEREAAGSSLAGRDQVRWAMGQLSFEGIGRSFGMRHITSSGMVVLVLLELFKVG